MAINLRSLKKQAASQAASPKDEVRDDEMLLLIVKLARGAQAPSYLNVRQRMGDEILTAEVAGRDLKRLEKDPAVVSFEHSKKLASY